MIEDDLIELKSKLHHQERMFETLITDLSTLRNELVKSKKDYTDLYDFSSSGYVTIDKSYTILRANYQAAFLLNIDRKQLHTKIFIHVMAASSQHTFINHIAMLYDTKCKQSCEIELLQKGGSKRAVILESMLIEDNLIRVCMVDMTNHRLTMNRLMQLEQTFNLTNHLFQDSSDAMAALDSQLYVNLLNRSFSELFSMIFATKINVGMSLIMALTDFPDLKEKMINACNDARLGNKTYVMIENHRNKQEIYHCYEICINSLYNPLNQKNEIYLRIKNLTEYKLQESQQFKQQAAIAQSNRISAMGEMASALAHEINQPLTAMMAYSRSCLFIINDKWGSKNRCADLMDPLEQIAVQGEYAGAIIHNIKNLMREGHVSPEETDMNALIRETLSILSYEIQDIKLKITLNLMDDLPQIMTNKTHIMQVISNLARNSMEAFQNTFELYPELWIETTQLDNHIHVHVRDNGPGIPHEFKNKILNTYFTTKPRGTGLGLGICRTLIEGHKGRLIIQEHEEKGAWFIFTLPIVSNQDSYV